MKKVSLLPVKNAKKGGIFAIPSFFDQFFTVFAVGYYAAYSAYTSAKRWG